MPINTTDILLGAVPNMNSPEDMRALWCVVYDGPIAWQGRSAFEEIEYWRSRACQCQCQVTDGD